LKKTFIDTAFWIAYLNRKDQFHQKAEEYFKVALGIYKIQTSCFILYETVTFINCSLKNHRLAIDFLDRIEEAQILGQLNILKVTEEIQEEALILFRKIDDKELRFTAK